MKLIIDIDESLLDGIKSDNFDFARQVVRSFQGTIASSIANGTPIPDNATNGEVLDKIRDEIERLHYHPKLDFIKNDEVVDMVLDIIDKYTG